MSYVEPSAGHSVKPPKAKPEVHFFLAQNNPSNLTANILLMIDFSMKKNWQPVNHS
jgi:hypothetical protein